MKILIVHNRYLQAGGEDVAVEAEAALLARKGHDVHRMETSNEELLQLSSSRAAMNTVWNSAARASVARRAVETRADIVHFHNTFPLLSPSTYYAAAQTSAVVQTLHNYRLVCPAATLLRDGKNCEVCVGNVPWRGVVHKCYRESRAATFATAAMSSTHRVIGTWARKVDAYIALTSFARDIFVRGGLPADKVHVKPNFVDPDPGFAHGVGVGFLYVGRLEEGKGIRVLMSAWRLLQNPLPLRIIGTGPLESQVQAFAAEFKNVELLGQVPRTRVVEELKRARALIAPMLWLENFPLSICEAMATGCAIIAADNANVSAILNHGGAGVLFRTGDGAALAHAIKLVATDDALCVRVTETARREYEMKYTADANYRALMSIYEHSGIRAARV
ncbi:MAG TPA: glycosyltransferase family 4 protein [Longimicrobiales bacterium]|nr:glycosyltransferase family 4 protein [Longimicrobiales bacterium]